MAVAHNDINVLERSHVFATLAESNAALMRYEGMGHTYTKGYYKIDGIYLEWPIFMKTHHDSK
jgi:hypothetical protein